MSQFVRRSDLVITDRIRECKEEDVTVLAKDIMEKGLLQPIVIETLESLRLIAGEHRNDAISMIDSWSIEMFGEVGTYKFNGETVSCDLIPYVLVGSLTPEQLIEYEVAENLVRVQLTWQERTKALAKLQALRGAEGETITSGAARDLINAGDKRGATAIITEVSKALIVADHLDDPKVAGAKSQSEAWTAVRNKMHQVQKQILSDSEDEAAVERIDSPHNFIHGDMVEVMQGLPAGSFDLILADLPYGSGADTWKSKFIDTPHDYKDDIKTATRLHACLFHEGYRVCAEHANLFAFCDPKFWNRWEEMARLAGWSTWSRPLVWKKSGEGIRPWGTKGFAYTYETILFATKGQKGLLQSVNDVIDIYKITSNRLHGAQKPVDLYAHLMGISTLPGGTVLDPTCGSGTVFPAASSSRLIATGIEFSDDYADIARARNAECATAYTPIFNEADGLTELDI